MLQQAKYETHRAVVRLAGELSNGSIFALCDEIDLALDYYKYPLVEIQIDSPGGPVDSLDYYLTRLKSWRADGLRVSTLAMTRAAGAAAVILALGDRGLRRAYPSARLQFRHAAAPGVGESLLRSVGVPMDGTLAVLADLQEADRLLMPAEALALGLIDALES